MNEPVVCSRWVMQALTARATSHPASTALPVPPVSTGKIQALIPVEIRRPAHRPLRPQPSLPLTTIKNCIDCRVLCYLQRIGKIGDIRRFVYQWITIFFSRFCPARGDRSRSVSAQIRGRISHLYSGSPRRAISRRLSYCGQTRDLARTSPAPG
jgi:hypothetical protein